MKLETGSKNSENRLFLGWFNTYAHRDRYVVRSAEGKMEGIDNFAALFIRLTNPQIDDILEEFNEITSILFDPSENNMDLQERPIAIGET